MTTPQDQGLLDRFRHNERLALIFGRLLLVGMMVCLAAGLQRIVEQIAVGWQGAHLPWLAAVVALEAVTTAGQVRQSRQMELSPLAYRAVEWVVLLVLLRIFLYARQGWERFLDDLAVTGAQLFGRVFDQEYLLTAAVLLLLWGLATWLMTDLFEIESALVLLQSEEYEKYFSNCAAIRNALANRLMMLGLGLAVVTALVQADLRWLTGAGGPAPRITLVGSGWYVLGYFVLMILLLALTHFSTLRAGWAWERLPIDRTIAGRWLGFGLLVLLLVGGVVSLLPTRYSLGLLQTLGFLLEWTLTILVTLFMFIFMGLSFLLSWILSLFRGRSQGADPAPAAEIPRLEFPALVAAPSSGIEFLQSLLFWLVLIVVAGIAFYQYLRQNRAFLARWSRLRRGQGWSRLLSWLHAALVSITQGARRTVSTALRSGVERLRRLRAAGGGASGSAFINPNRLTPRQRVRFFYLALLRRGAEAGYPRRPEQTPQEYEQMLRLQLAQAQLPEHGLEEQSALGELTGAFQEARYSQHPISLEQAKRVKVAWQQLRQTLRHRSR